MKTLDTDLLEEMTCCLVDEFDPEQIILFGSHTRGTPNDDNVDLFAIVPESDLSPTQRATSAYRALRGIRVEPSDTVVRTHAEVERHRHGHVSLARQVLEQGEVLYG